MTGHTIHYESWTPEELVGLLDDYERSAPASLRDLWHAHIRATPECTFEGWNAQQESHMYDQVTTSLRTNARMYLNALPKAKDLGHATHLLDSARLATAALLHYELLVRMYPQAAQIELQRGELGATGHTAILQKINQHPTGGIRDYVDNVGQYYSLPRSSVSQ